MEGKRGGREREIMREREGEERERDDVEGKKGGREIVMLPRMKCKCLL